MHLHLTNVIHERGARLGENVPQGSIFDFFSVTHDRAHFAQDVDLVSRACGRRQQSAMFSAAVRRRSFGAT